MRHVAGGPLRALARISSLVLLAVLGTIALMRLAPGYFTDANEMDAQYSSQARAALLVQQQREGSLLALSKGVLAGWMHGDLGQSRQYGIPVKELLPARARITAVLLVSSVAGGWLAAFVLAVPLSARRTRSGEVLVATPSAILLAVPAGALAMACMISGVGGPGMVLAALVAARDFKFLYRILRETWTSPHLLYARGQGMEWKRIFIRHLLPGLRAEMFSLARMSFVLALSAIVPVEVIFDVPGLGQLAWTAAMNRDLPVLVAVTLIMAASVGMTSFAADPARLLRTSSLEIV